MPSGVHDGLLVPYPTEVARSFHLPIKRVGRKIADFRQFPDRPPVTRLGPANRCIYCGGRDIDLTDEHVIADGFGGTLILADSSCLDCAKKINLAEQPILRRMSGEMRAVIGVSSGKRRANDTGAVSDVRLFSGEIDNRKPFTVKAEANLPWFLPWFVLLGPPIILGKLGYVSRKSGFMQIRPADFAHRMQQANPPDVGKLGLEVSVNFNLCGQMVAKSAHAFACAYVREEHFHPYLPALSVTMPNAFQMHCLFSSEPCDQEYFSLHDVQLFEARSHNFWDPHTYLVCQFRIFSCFSGPIMTVVVGHLL